MSDIQVVCFFVYQINGVIRKSKWIFLFYFGGYFSGLVVLYPNSLVTVKTLPLPEDFGEIESVTISKYTKHYYASTGLSTSTSTGLSTSIGSERVASALGSIKSLGLLCKGSGADAALIAEMNNKVEDAAELIRIIHATFEKDLELTAPFLYNDIFWRCDPAHNQDMYHPYWYHPDHLGSSSYITNLDGEINQHLEYLPFGELLVEEHLNSYNSPFKFNAKEFDAETGNYYYGARYYNPKWSIWLSVDPLADHPKQIGISPYAYTANNPINFIDPDGKLFDRYTVDGEGNVCYYDDKGGDTIDYLMDENGNEISVTDTSILPQLEEERTDWNMRYGGKDYPGNYAETETSTFSEAKKVFEFVSKASTVEWKLNKHSDGVFLGTNRYSDAVNSSSVGLSNLTLLESYHSHPGISPKDDVASGYSRADIQRMAKQGFQPENYGDVSNTYRVYNELINAGKITPDNGYKGAPKFYIYRPHVKKPYYFQYDPWNTKF